MLLPRAGRRSFQICFLICKMRDWTRWYLRFFKFWQLVRTHFPLPYISLPSSLVPKVFSHGKPMISCVLPSQQPWCSQQQLPTAWVPGHRHALQEAPMDTPPLHLQLSFLKLILHWNRKHLASLRKRVLGVHLLMLQILAAIYNMPTHSWITCSATE